MTRLCIVFDRLRSEEKMLKTEAQSLGFDISMLDAKTAVLNTDTIPKDIPQLGDVALERCVSYFRGLHMTNMLESMELPVINTYGVASTCGNKMAMTIRLKRANIPTPKTHFALSAEAAEKVFESVGYPLVIKPVIGSWGRGVMPIRNHDTLGAVIEGRAVTDGPFDRIFYLQEIIQRPPHVKDTRDIRVITVGGEPIAAMYRRAAEGFRANVAIGGDPEPCKITPRIAELASAASEAVGGGILGIDMMEDGSRSKGKGDGEEIVVHEVNNTVEFKGLAKVAEKNIPRSMIQYAASIAKR